MNCGSLGDNQKNYIDNQVVTSHISGEEHEINWIYLRLVKFTFVAQVKISGQNNSLLLSGLENCRIFSCNTLTI